VGHSPAWFGLFRPRKSAGIVWHCKFSRHACSVCRKMTSGFTRERLDFGGWDKSVLILI
jgi:hypothetical protein